MRKNEYLWCKGLNSELCSKGSRNGLNFVHTIQTLNDLKKKTSIFSFFHNVFHPSERNFQFFTHIKVVQITDALNSYSSKMLMFGKELNHSNTGVIDWLFVVLIPISMLFQTYC